MAITELYTIVAGASECLAKRKITKEIDRAVDKAVVERAVRIGRKTF